MRRLVTLLAAVALLALPPAALAQSAGDEQYADPFGQVDQPKPKQDQPTQPAEPAPAPAPAAPAQPTPAATETGTTQNVAAAPTLPATGLPAGLLAAAGALLLAGGTTLRRLAS